MSLAGAATGALAGATAGAALGPVGAAIGALLGAAPDVLNALGIHLFNEGAASSAMDLIKTLTGKSDPSGVDIAGLSSEHRVTLQLGLAKIAADQAKAEIDADTAARQVEFEELRAQLTDIAGARTQTVALAQTGSKIAWGSPVISVMVVVLFAAMLVELEFRGVPEGSRDLMHIMLGTLAAGFVQVLNYWLGSSSSSQSKDATIKAALVK